MTKICGDGQAGRQAGGTCLCRHYRMIIRDNCHCPRIEVA